METPELDWRNAAVDNDSNVTVQFVGESPGGDWLAEFGMILSTLEQETRGQGWSGLRLDSDEVVIEGVHPTQLPSLKQYLKDAAAHATQGVLRNQRALEQARENKRHQDEA